MVSLLLSDKTIIKQKFLSNSSPYSSFWILIVHIITINCLKYCIITLLATYIWLYFRLYGFTLERVTLKVFSEHNFSNFHFIRFNPLEKLLHVSPLFWKCEFLFFYVKKRLFKLCSINPFKMFVISMSDFEFFLNSLNLKKNQTDITEDLLQFIEVGKLKPITKG